MKATLLFFFLLLGITALRLYFQTDSIGFNNREKIAVSIRILDNPQIRHGMQSFDIDIHNKGRVNVVTTLFPRYWYGEKITVSGSINQRVTEAEQLVNTVYFPEITRVENDLGFFITGGIKKRVETSFKAYLPPTSSALLLGIVFGGRQGMPEAFIDRLQATGVMHVVAASGMNVTLLAGFLLALFTHIFTRKKSIVITMIVLVWYTFLAGLEPSIVRASIMGIFAFSAVLLGRQQQGIWILFLTACLMVLVSPVLLQDIGFQLSFAATLGILVIKPLLSKKQTNQSVLQLFHDDVSSTIAAQIATLPLLLLYFQSIGVLSIFINLLILWTIPPIMVLGAAAAFVGFFMPFFGGILALTALPFLLYFEMVIELTSMINPSVQVGELPVIIILGYYVLLSSVLLLFRHKKRKS